MSDTELKIGIRVTADTKGAVQASDALRDVTKQVDQSADSTKVLGRESEKSGELLQSFGKKGGTAREAFEGLERASQGGIRGIFGLSKAWLALTEAFAANPFTAILVVAVALLPLLEKIAEWTGVFGNSAEEAKAKADLLAKSLEGVHRDADELNKATLEAFQEKLAAINRSAKEAEDHLKRMSELASKLDDIEKATEIEAIKNDKSLTEEEKVGKIVGINKKYAAAVEARMRDDEDKSIAAKQATVDQLAPIADAATKAVAAAKARRDATSGSALASRLVDLDAQMEEAKKHQKFTTQQVGGAGAQAGQFVSVQVLSAESASEQAKIRSARERVQAQYDLTQDKNGNGPERAVAAAKALELAEAENRAVKEKQRAAQEAVAAEKSKVADERSGRTQLSAAEARRESETQKPVVAEAQKKDQEVATRKMEQAANAGIMGKIGQEARGADNFAINEGRAAKKSGDTGLFDAAKSLHEAAQAAQNTEASAEQAKALVAAAEAFKKALDARKQENARLTDSIKVLAEQIKGLTSVNNQH